MMRIRYSLVAVLVGAWTLVASAAHFTPQQLQTLKTYIAGQPDLSSQPSTPDGHFEIARLLNLAAAGPNNVAWKTSVPIGDVGKALNGTELAGLTSLNHTRMQTLAIYLSSGVNPSLASNRQFFDDIFSGAGGVNTRAALLALWKRVMTRAEKVYATGTGSDASPATLVVEGAIDPDDVQAARALP
jgi:hypothetical protein